MNCDVWVMMCTVCIVWVCGLDFNIVAPNQKTYSRDIFEIQKPTPPCMIDDDLYIHVYTSIIRTVR